jgi:pimeloyl-ACP methyl ester carboxylesterase
MRHFLALDLSDRLGKITCPVLALNGTKDRQVNGEENLNALRNGLAGQKEIHAIEGVNHLFQHCNTGNPSEYKDIEETFAPEVLEIIVTWMKKR